MKTPTVSLIPAFENNYFFCGQVGESAFVVDPGHAQEVLDFLKERQLKLKLILLTHHHSDHIGGVEELQKQTGAQVYGPADLKDHGLKCDRICRDGDSFEFESIKFNTLEIPGHTLDHLAYHAPEPEWLFCGDTLFSLGCGRIFEGTYEQMFNSLSRLKSLPGSTKVFCAHEYTLVNLKFSLQYLQENKVSDKLLYFYADLHQKIIFLRAQNTPTIPSTIDFEKQYNLFLKAKTVEEFKKVREARNTFSPAQTPQ
ncbi:MAG: hydroxyacylglutathione hydrolase [Bdellovibrionota bacterium]